MNNKDNKTIQSPCVDQCCLDENDICLGCFRRIDEITGWYDATDASKKAILENCKQRKNQHKKLYG